MTDSTQISTACHALVGRAVRACRRAGWHATANELQSDLRYAATDLRELLIVRDAAEHALASLEANGLGA